MTIREMKKTQLEIDAAIQTASLLLKIALERKDYTTLGIDLMTIGKRLCRLQEILTKEKTNMLVTQNGTWKAVRNDD